MKKLQLSIASIFRSVGAGVIITSVILCVGIYFVTHNITAVIVCLITVAALSIWAFILVSALQKHLSYFTDNVCETIDVMMKGETVSRKIFDEDTLLDRIRYQLYRLYQMMNAGRQTIEEQKTELQGMISDISHQFKTPVTNLKLGTATLLEQELPRKQRTEYLQSMYVQLDKLDFLMSALLKSSRLETGVITQKKQNASIYETLAAALGSIFLKAEEKQLKVEVKCPDDLMVFHDPKWTAEALFNILDNAVKYTPANGSITITVSRREAYTQIDITDTGKGIPESHYALIFKRFYREPEVHNVEGVGLGLYLTREIISKQGGSVKVTSASGKGTTFTIFLPDIF